jgi:uridine kinase
MIIHIAGPSGSGKTTIGDKLEAKTKFKIIHTDDIDNKNSLSVLKTMKNRLDYGKFDSATADLNKKILKNKL